MVATAIRWRTGNEQPMFGQRGFSWHCGSRAEIAQELAQHGEDWNNSPFVWCRRPTSTSRWCRHGMKFQYPTPSQSFVAWPTHVSLSLSHSAISAMGRSQGTHAFCGRSALPAMRSREFRAALLRAFGQADERPFRPHVTLARLRDKGRAIARKHPVDQTLRSRSGSTRSSSCNRPLPVGAATKSLHQLSLGAESGIAFGGVKSWPPAALDVQTTK